MCLGYLMVLIILSSPSLPATAGGRAISAGGRLGTTLRYKASPSLSIACGGIYMHFLSI